MKRYTQALITILTLFLFTFLLSGCENEQNSPSKAIEAYIQALSDKDSTRISNISCADWEQSALLEVDSLTAVGSKTVNLNCKQSGQDGADVYVSCTGSLDMDYNGEGQQIDLSTRTYIARQLDGEWHMCGYH